MEQTHAVVVMPEYMELVNFKKEVENGKIPFAYNNDRYGSNYYQFFLSKEDALKVLSDKNKEEFDRAETYYLELKKLREENERLKKFEPKPAEKPKEISINDLKKMSYWEFRKWCKS